MAKNQKRKSLASMAGGKLVAFDEAIQSRLRMNPDKWVENHNNSEGGILGSANRFGNLVMHAANPKADVPKHVGIGKYEDTAKGWAMLAGNRALQAGAVTGAGAALVGLSRGLGEAIDALGDVPIFGTPAYQQESGQLPLT